MTFWAHSDRTGLAPDHPDSNWQPLADHLKQVASISRTLAELAAPSNTHLHQLAEWTGLLHDFGKYSDCFQHMILTGAGRCPHAIHGAVVAHHQSGLRAPHIAHAVGGHHAGLQDRSILCEKIKQFAAEALKLQQRAERDCPQVGQLLRSGPPELEALGNRFDLFTRILFSCLIDADRLDTSRRPIVQAPLAASVNLQTLLARIANLAQGAASPVVQAARKEVLEDCLNAALLPNRLLSLSVPTGGGKTLAAMAFALKRASLFPEAYRRIIVVVPYLAIIEQNAQVYSDIFGEQSILEHHSGTLNVKSHQGTTPYFSASNQPETDYETPIRRIETENWDAPLIVTTSVRFFESLFSNHPSDLRRVHNIARSIVILDEVQVLPRDLLAPLLAMIGELTNDWGCTFVLSTATKPAFERGTSQQDARWEPGTVKEIVRSPAQLHRSLKRVTIDWRIKTPADWPQVAQWISGNRQALCVVNLRDHARLLYDELDRLCGSEALFHLSTRMCAAHRLQVIGEIRRRLATGEPCLVVSTQLIEAGVDVDFPIAFRALGPLDSIIQTAGRADREGKLTALAGKPGGKLVVFLPLDHRLPPNAYTEASAKTQSLAAQRDIQCDDLEAMEIFFERYYGESADLGNQFLELRNTAKFATLADRFEMISSRTQDVFVPFGAGKRHLDELSTVGRMTSDLRRKLQHYVVGLTPWEFLAAGSVLYQLRDSEIWIASETAYSKVKGLEFSIEPDNLIL